VTYAWNTAGAIAGSLAGGFGLLPILTAPGAWVAVVLLLSALCAASLVHSARGRLGWGLLPPALTAGLAVLLVAFSEGPTAVWRHSGIGAGRATIDRSSPNATRAWVHSVRRDTIWEAEGVEASVAINVGDGLSFYVNGKADGNAVGDVGTQVMLGVLPALLHPDPSTAMVVGMGTGETAGWLAETPGMQRVDVVELEHAIDDVARRCALANHDVMRHPKVRRIYNDAREVLLTTPERYDIISSEPSNPYRAGIAGLFTREFYLAARNRLRDRGLFVQWLQGYEVDDRTVRIVFATLSSVFPHIEVWQSKQDDMLLVCSTSPMSYDGDRLHAKLAHDSYREAVAVAWRAVDLEGIAARFIADSEFVRDYGAREAGAENTDSRNRIEYMFARSLGRSTDFSIEELRRLAAADGRDQPPT
ncbi:MAG: fused MFS/spermidine synthase, partial [Planctomycetota bacterium]